MDEKENLFWKLKLELESKLSFLEDKPEETSDSSLKALWHKAHGNSFSAVEAEKKPLPDLTEPQVVILHQLVEQRLNGKPLAHITGRQNFMGIELLCDNRALIPRKETEILGRTAIEQCRNIAGLKQSINVFDICCGCGNLGIALACYISNITVYSSDLSPEAVELTKENISFLNLARRVNVIQSDLFQNFESDIYYGNINLIVCNPPYISSSKVAKMDSEISSNEPSMAFDGGMVGMKVIQKLIREALKFLAKDGWLIFEVGVGQGPFIMQLCNNSQLYKKIEPVSDVMGNIRVIAASLADEKI
jgi:release factor glutamine methyltransferase